MISSGSFRSSDCARRAGVPFGEVTLYDHASRGPWQPSWRARSENASANVDGTTAGVIRLGVDGHHHHDHGPARYDRAFAIGISFNLAFVIAEVIYGARAHSLALTADAGHNLGDVLGLGLAWVGTMLAARRPTTRRTYGLRRFSILAALGNGGFLLIAVGAIAVEAVHRMSNPGPVATKTVIVVALIGICINTGTALGFMRGRKSDLNIHGAWLHMMGDAAASAGVVVAALGIASTGWTWIDPVVSLLLVALITAGNWGLLRDSLNLALDAVPPGIDTDEVTALSRLTPGRDRRSPASIRWLPARCSLITTIFFPPVLLPFPSRSRTQPPLIFRICKASSGARTLK